jgi:AAA15 family ATPase/GTPase
MNDEHFIKNIEIKNFKLFKDFKAEGFGRVNLIGGKNNVGKTAFMEAVFVNTIGDNAYNYILASSYILYLRNYINFIRESYIIDIESFSQDSNDEIIINTNINRTSYKAVKKNSVEIDEKFNINNKEEIIPRGSFKNLPVGILWNQTNHFIPSSQIEDDYLNILHDSVRLNMHEDILNKNISQLFGSEFQKFLMRDKKPLIYNNEKWYSLSLYGDGIKRFITMMSALYASRNGYLFLDEIENGIHYTNLDKLWEIILTVSKEQNVQVFATTHSKECIESYARVAKRLGDEEIGFIELGRNKFGKLDSIVFDSERFHRFMELDNEVRGW